MKIKLTVQVIIFFVVQPVLGQWVTQSTTTTIREWYTGVHFVDENTGWVVGWDGLIKKTINGGLTWINQNSETEENLTGVYFIDKNNGWVIGDAHDILGNTLLKTTNGGNTWELINLSRSHYNDIQFIGSTHGWIVGRNGRVFHTNNGGETWVNQSVGTTSTLYSVMFINKSVGWITSANGRIWKTINSGTTWTQQPTPTSYLEQTLYDVFFVDSNNGWATGHKGLILATNNGGETWNQIATDIAGNNSFVNTIYFTSATTGFADGRADSVLKTTDGGYTWTKSYADVGFGNKLFFINSNTGWYVGASGISKTSNGGALSTTVFDKQNDNNFSIYPNPASDFLSIDNKNSRIKQIEILNNSGEVMISLAKEINHRIDISKIPSGLYFVRIIDDKQEISVQKIIITR